MLPLIGIGTSMLTGIIGGGAASGVATTVASVGTKAIGAAVASKAIGSAAVGSLAKGIVSQTVKTYTLEEAMKLYGAYYIGKQVAHNQNREQAYPQAGQNQAQNNKGPKLICYVKTDDGLVPVYEE